MRFADVPLSLHSISKAQYKCQVIIIIIKENLCEAETFLPYIII